MIFVSTASPNIAITGTKPAILALSPMPFRPNAKIAGNMIDKNKLVVTRLLTQVQLGWMTAIAITQR